MASRSPPIGLTIARVVPARSPSAIAGRTPSRSIPAPGRSRRNAMESGSLFPSRRGSARWRRGCSHPGARGPVRRSSPRISAPDAIASCSGSGWSRPSLPRRDCKHGRRPSQWTASMMGYDPALAIPVLERAPGVLRALLDGLPPAWTDAREGPERWSPYEVVGHLVHGERTDWIPRAEMILRVGEAEPFPPFDRVAMFRDSAGKSLSALIDLFARLRVE